MLAICHEPAASRSPDFSLVSPRLCACRFSSLCSVRRQERLERKKGSNDEDVFGSKFMSRWYKFNSAYTRYCGLWVSLLLLKFVSAASEGLLDWFSVIMWTETMPEWRHGCDKIYWQVQSGAAAPMAFVSCKLITRAGAIAQWHHSSMEPTSERKNIFHTMHFWRFDWSRASTHL